MRLLTVFFFFFCNRRRALQLSVPGLSVTSRADCSFGVVLYSLFYRVIPSVMVEIAGREDLAMYAWQVANGHRPELKPAVAPPEVNAVIEACWKGLPSLRPTAVQVVHMLQDVQEKGECGGRGAAAAGERRRGARAEHRACAGRRGVRLRAVQWVAGLRLHVYVMAPRSGGHQADRGRWACWACWAATASTYPEAGTVKGSTGYL